MPAITGVGVLVRIGHSRRTVTLTNASTGETWTLTFDGQTTAAIVFNAAASAVQSALEALAHLEVGDVAVTGNAGGPYTITFQGRYAGQEVGSLTGTGTGDLSVAVTNPGPSYVTVAGQRGATLNRGRSIADATSKDSVGWEENVPTQGSWGVELDALLITDDAGYAALKAAHRYGRRLNVLVLHPDNSTESGIGTLTDFPEEAPHDDMASVSATIQGSGPLTPA